MTLKEGKKLLTVVPSVDCNTHPLTDVNEEAWQLTHPSLRPVLESASVANVTHESVDVGSAKNPVV